MRFQSVCTKFEALSVSIFLKYLLSNQLKYFKDYGSQCIGTSPQLAVETFHRSAAGLKHLTVVGRYDSTVPKLTSITKQELKKKVSIWQIYLFLST